MTIIMQVVGLRCLHDFGLWILSYRTMHDLWDTRLNDVTNSFKHFMSFIKAIDIPSLRSFGARFISFKMGYIYEELALEIHGGYLFPFY